MFLNSVSQFHPHGVNLLKPLHQGLKLILSMSKYGEWDLISGQIKTIINVLSNKLQANTNKC